MYISTEICVKFHQHIMSNKMVLNIRIGSILLFCHILFGVRFK